MRNSGMLNSSKVILLCSQIESIGHAVAVNDNKHLLIAVDKFATEIMRIVDKSI
jgi:hypothetical protein